MTFVVATEFDRLLSEAYAMDGQAAAMAAGTLGLGDELDLLADHLPTADDLLDTADDAPAIRLINGIIADAARNGVSDIHIEPYETGLVVRMRIDGVLRETLRMPPHVAPVVVSRVKVMARLDIAERRVPQDGADRSDAGRQAARRPRVHAYRAARASAWCCVFSTRRMPGSRSTCSA